jgi:hypothetical protein
VEGEEEEPLAPEAVVPPTEELQMAVMVHQSMVQMVLFTVVVAVVKARQVLADHRYMGAAVVASLQPAQVFSAAPAAARVLAV